MTAFKQGDKVKIIQRKPGNDTGFGDYNKPNGDVGKIGYIVLIRSNRRPYQINTDLNQLGGNYLGLFEEDDLELIIDKPDYEIY